MCDLLDSDLTHSCVSSGSCSEALNAKAISRGKPALRQKMGLPQKRTQRNLQICALYPAMQFLLE
jgi:hypothetical protein